MAEKRPKRLDQSYILPDLPREKVVLVTQSDWGRLIDRIEKAGPPTQFFESAGWAFIGAAVSGVSTWATLPAGEGSAAVLRAYFGAGSVSALFVGVFALVCSHVVKGKDASIRGFAIEDMRAIAAKQAERDSPA